VLENIENIITKKLKKTSEKIIDIKGGRTCKKYVGK
jgi:hypothetical protein